MSVNFFSQVYSWYRGSNVGRGRPLSNPIESFHKGQFRDEYEIWMRSRLYFQLWMYYQLQGHHPQLLPPKCLHVCAKTPMRYSTDEKNPISGLENYLRFAMVCSDVVPRRLERILDFLWLLQTSEEPHTGDYHSNWFTTTQADIDKAIKYMSKYPRHTPVSSSSTNASARSKQKAWAASPARCVWPPLTTPRPATLAKWAMWAW